MREDPRVIPRPAKDVEVLGGTGDAGVGAHRISARQQERKTQVRQLAQRLAVEGFGLRGQRRGLGCGAHHRCAFGHGVSGIPNQWQSFGKVPAARRAAPNARNIADRHGASAAHTGGATTQIPARPRGPRPAMGAAFSCWLWWAASEPPDRRKERCPRALSPAQLPLVVSWLDRAVCAGRGVWASAFWLACSPPRNDAPRPTLARVGRGDAERSGRIVLMHGRPAQHVSKRRSSRCRSGAGSGGRHGFCRSFAAQHQWITSTTVLDRGSTMST